MVKLVPVLALIFSLTACDGITSSGDQVYFKTNIKDKKIESIENLKGSFSVINNSDEEVIFGFSSGCQRAFRIKQGEQVLLDSRQFFFCTMALTSFSLAPGEVRTFGVNLDIIGSYIQDELDKIKPGTYQLEMFLRNDQSPKISESFTVK